MTVAPVAHSTARISLTCKWRNSRFFLEHAFESPHRRSEALKQRWTATTRTKDVSASRSDISTLSPSWQHRKFVPHQACPCRQELSLQARWEVRVAQVVLRRCKYPSTRPCKPCSTRSHMPTLPSSCSTSQCQIPTLLRPTPSPYAQHTTTALVKIAKSTSTTSTTCTSSCAPHRPKRSLPRRMCSPRRSAQRWSRTPRSRVTCVDEPNLMRANLTTGGIQGSELSSSHSTLLAFGRHGAVETAMGAGCAVER